MRNAEYYKTKIIEIESETNKSPERFALLADFKKELKEIEDRTNNTLTREDKISGGRDSTPDDYPPEGVFNGR